MNQLKWTQPFLLLVGRNEKRYTEDTAPTTLLQFSPISLSSTWSIAIKGTATPCARIPTYGDAISFSISKEDRSKCVRSMER